MIPILFINIDNLPETHLGNRVPVQFDLITVFLLNQPLKGYYLIDIYPADIEVLEFVLI